MNGIAVTTLTSPEAVRAAAPSLLALADAARASDGHPPLSDQTRLLLTRAEVLWAGMVAGDDAPVALAVAVREGAGAVLELVVHPENRRRGLGRALASAAAEAVADLNLPEGISVWAHGMLPGSAELAAAYGLTPVRELRRMRAAAPALAALPEAELPDAVVLRAYRPGHDDAAWLALNAAAFADHPEQGSLTKSDLADRRAEDWFDAAGLLLAERDGTLLGYHWTKVPVLSAGATGPREGEVYAVGVSPEARGLGLGRALTLAGLHHMRQERGVQEVVLYVDAGNSAAVRLYESLGFALDAADAQYRR